MKKISLVVLVFAVVAPALAAEVELIEGKDRVDVKIDGRLFTTYQWGQNWPRPVLVPVRTPTGIEVSRRHPLTELKGGSDDHLHHTGPFFSVDGVNDTKFWNNTEPLPQIRHKAIKDITREQDSATLVTTSQWIDRNGTVLLEDERTMTFRAGSSESEYAIDFSLDMTTEVDRAVFEDTEEGVFAIRVADCLREKGPKTFLKPGDPAPQESLRGTGADQCTCTQCRHRTSNRRTACNRCL